MSFKEVSTNEVTQDGGTQDMGAQGDFEDTFEDQSDDGDDFDPNGSFEDWDLPAKSKNKKTPEKPTKELNKEQKDLPIDKSSNNKSSKPLAGEPEGEEDEGGDEDEQDKDKAEEKNAKSEKVSEKKPEEADKKSASKGKKHYLKIGGETYGIAGDAVIDIPIDGKKESFTLQEVINEVSGKKYAERKINEYQKLESQRQFQEKNFKNTLQHYKSIGDKIKSIAQDETKNPLEAMEIFLDAFGFDSYDLIERMKLHDLDDTVKLMQMSEVERKAHFLEQRNKHLLSKAEKRNANDQQTQKYNNYASKVDQLRKSLNVSEAQFVEAYDELTDGNPEVEVSDEEIVNWAASKPHRQEVQKLLEPYEEQFDDETYSDIVLKLSHHLLNGSVDKETMKKMISEQFGDPQEVRDLNEKFNPVGKPKKQQSTPTKTKHSYESFDDFSDDD